MAALNVVNRVCQQELGISPESSQHASTLSDVANGPRKLAPESTSVMVGLSRQVHARSLTRVRLVGHKVFFPRHRSCCDSKSITPSVLKKPAGHGKTQKSPRCVSAEEFHTSPPKPGIPVKPVTHPEMDTVRVRPVRACTVSQAVTVTQFAASDGKLSHMPSRRQGFSEHTAADLNETSQGHIAKTCKTTNSDLDIHRKSSTAKKLFEEKSDSCCPTPCSSVKCNRRRSLPMSSTMTRSPAIGRDRLLRQRQSLEKQVVCDGHEEVGKTGEKRSPGVESTQVAEASFLDRPITTSLSGQSRTNIFAVAEKLSESRGGSPRVLKANASVPRSRESSCESVPAKKNNKQTDLTSSPRPCRWKCIEHESCKMLFQPQSPGKGPSGSVIASTSAGRKRKRSSQKAKLFHCSDHVVCGMLSNGTERHSVISLPDLEGPSEKLSSSWLSKSRSSEICSESAGSLEAARNLLSEQIRNSPSKPGSSAALPLESRSHSASRCEEHTCLPLEADVKKRGRKPKKQATSTETAAAMENTALSSDSVEVRLATKPGRKKCVAALAGTDLTTSSSVIRRKRPAKKRSLSESVVDTLIPMSKADLLSSCNAPETSPNENFDAKRNPPGRRRQRSTVSGTGEMSAESADIEVEQPLPNTELLMTPPEDATVGIGNISVAKKRPVSAKRQRSVSVDCCPRQPGVNAARKLLQRGRTAHSRAEGQALGTSDVAGHFSSNTPNTDVKLAAGKGTKRATTVNYRRRSSTSVETAASKVTKKQPLDSSTGAVELSSVAEPADNCSLASDGKKKTGVKRRRRSASIEPDNLAAVSLADEVKKPSAKRRSSLVKACAVDSAVSDAAVEKSANKEPVNVIDTNDIETYLLGSAESRLSVNSDDHFELNASCSKSNSALSHLSSSTAVWTSRSQDSIVLSSSCSTLVDVSANIPSTARAAKKAASKRCRDTKTSPSRVSGDGFNDCGGDDVSRSVDAAESDSDNELPAMLTDVDDHFDVGDLIWVKYRQEPFWPAVVLKKTNVNRKCRIKLIFLNYLPDFKPNHYYAMSLNYNRKNMFPIARDFKQLKADGLAKCKDDSFGRAVSKVEDYLLDLASTASLQEDPASRLEFVRHFFAVDLTPNNGKEETACGEDEYTLPSCSLEKSEGPEEEDEEETEDYVDGDEDGTDSQDSKQAYPEHVQQRIAERFKHNEKLVEFISSETLKNHLFDVEYSRTKSSFCADFDLKSQTCRGRTELRLRGFGPIAEHEHMMYKVVEILEGYWDELCKQRGQENNHQQRYSYILHAWFPEAVVSAFQHVDNASREEAEIAFRKGIPRTAEEKEKELKQLHELMSQLSRRRSTDETSTE